MRGLRSTVEATARPGGPPLVSYAMTVAEVWLGGRRVVGADGTGVVVRVGPVTVADLAEELRRQLGPSGAGSSAALEAGLRLLDPRVVSGPRAATVVAPVLELTATAVPGVAGPVSLRLATTAVSVATPPAAPGTDGGAGAEPSAVRRGLQPPAVPPAGPATTAPVPAPGAPPEAAPEPSSGDRFGLRRRSPDGGASPRSGLLLGVVLMGAAVLNALLVAARAAFLVAKARR